MHTIEILGHALDLAARLGYSVREEWLAGPTGCPGGGCVLKGRKLLFLDLATGPDEQLHQILETLRCDPDALRLPMPQALGDLLGRRKVA
jgi:hypothetical protein